MLKRMRSQENRWDPSESPALRDVNRILFVARGGFSDMLRTIPYIRALRRHYPQARISVLAAQGQGKVFSDCPYVDTIIPDILRDHSAGHATSRPVKMVRLAKLAARLYGKFDLVIGPCFEGTTANLLAFLVGARYRVGFDLGLGFLLTTNLGALDHELTSDERNSQLLEAIGIDEVDPTLEMHTSAGDQDHAKAFLRQHLITEDELLIGLHPGSDWACQQWPIDRWAQLGDEITNRYQAKLVLTGTQDEIGLAEQISDLMATRPISAVGQTTLGQLAALIGTFTLVVAVDSVAPSIALARGVPVVLLCRSGYTQWRRAPWPGLEVLYNDALGWPTWSAECRWAKQRDTTRCSDPDHIGIDGMGLITVQEVLQAVDRQLSSNCGVHNGHEE